MTSPIPAPDRYRCPVCGVSLASSRCSACGADLVGPRGDELWAIDNQLYQLSLRRLALVEVAVGVGRHTGPLPAPPAPPASGAFPPPPPGWALPAPPPRAPGPETSSILLALGVALLVGAALVFAAVSWNHLGAIGQGTLLVGLTLAAGFATDRAARRRLRGTAEALGVLTVVLGPLLAQAVRITLDLPATSDRTWADLADWSWWPFALMVIGGAALAFGRWVCVRSPQHLGVVLVQVGLPVWVALAPVSPIVVAVVLVVQATLVALGPLVWQRDHPTAGTWAFGAVAAWGLGLVVALGAALQFDLGTADHLWTAAALGLTAVGAGVVAWRWRDTPTLADPAAFGATGALFLGVGRLLVGWVPDVAWWPIMGLLAALGLVLAARAGARAAAISAGCWIAVVFAAVPVLDGAIAVADAAGVTGAAWRHTASAGVLTKTELGVRPAWASSLAGIVALAAAVVGARGARRQATGALVALAALAVLVVPALAGGSVALVTLATLAAALGLAGVAWRSPNRGFLASASLGVLAIGLVWAAGNAGLVLAVGAVAAVLGLAAVVRGVGAGDVTLAAAGAVLAAGALPAEAGWAAWVLGAEPAWSLAVASIAAAGLGVLACVGRVPPSTAEFGARDAAASAGGVVLVVAHVAAVLSIGIAGPGPLAAASSAALAVGIVALAVVAVSLVRSGPQRWLSAVAAGAEAVVLVWVRLAISDVSVVEAYTVPVAVLLVGGTVLAAWAGAGRSPEGLRSRPSWSLEGPALVMAVGPTALTALSDPGLVRQIVGLGLGAVLLAVGAGWRRRAPLDIGAAAVVVLGLHALLPYASDVPRWMSLGVVGAVLVALGATFEDRRRDLSQAKRRYASLR